MISGPVCSVLAIKIFSKQCRLVFRLMCTLNEQISCFKQSASVVVLAVAINIEPAAAQVDYGCE